MLMKDIKVAIEMAKTKSFDKSIEHSACGALSGLALEKTTRFATLDMVAWFVQYHCLLLNGQFDGAYLQDMVWLLKNRVKLV